MKLEDLFKKYPFVYEVNQKYYYLGQGVCKECDSTFAISYFEDYKKFLEQIGRDVIASQTRNIDEESLDTLIYCFRKVKAYSDIKVEPEDYKTYRQRISDLVDTLSILEQQKLLQQLEDFVNVFYYYYKKIK